MEQIRLIVARHRPELFPQLLGQFGSVDEVTVLLDRRQAGAPSLVTGRADRRRASIEAELRGRGWSVLPGESATPPPGVRDLSRVQTLLDSFRVLTQELQLDRLLQLIMERARVLMDADRSSLFIVDHERGELWSTVAQGLEVKELRLPVGRGIVGMVAATGVSVNIPDAYADSRFNPEVDRQTGYRTRTILTVPVREVSGRVVAVIQVLNRRDGVFERADEELLHAFSGQVAIALRNAEQIERIEQRERVSALLLDVMKSFSSELEVDQLLRKIMARTSEVLDAERSTLFLVDRRTHEIWSKVAQGEGMVEIRLPLGRGIAGTVAATGETVNIADAYADPRFNPEVDRRTGYRTRTILCAPVRDAQGEVVGVAQVLNKRDGSFTQRDEELLKALSAQACVALDNARLFESVVYMKNYNESILACMATGVMTLDAEGLVSSVNPAFRQIFGLGDDVEIGRPVAQVLDVKHNEKFVHGLAECAVHGRAHTEYELRYGLPGSESVSLNVSVVPLADSKKQPLGVVVVAEDITQEQRLMSTLCRYVTREIAEEILRQKDSLRLGGNRQPVSILFADIRNFTTLSEAHEPEKIVEFLNDYFGLMVHEIFAEQGTLDKFMGDGLMALFGAPISRPDDPVRAVRAALAMRRSLKRFNEAQRAKGGLVVETGIGICHGDSISGNIGSEQRMEYTVIGDTVNLASRLEGLTKQYDYKILINESVYEQVRGEFECVLLGEELVKGKQVAVKIYGVREPEG